MISSRSMPSIIDRRPHGDVMPEIPDGVPELQNQEL